MIGLLAAMGLAGASVDLPPVYGPVLRPRIDRADPDDGRRYQAAEPEQVWLDEPDDGVQVKWRGRKVKLRVPLG